MIAVEEKVQGGAANPPYFLGQENVFVQQLPICGTVIGDHPFARTPGEV